MNVTLTPHWRVLVASGLEKVGTRGNDMIETKRKCLRLMLRCQFPNNSKVTVNFEALKWFCLETSPLSSRYHNYPGGTHMSDMQDVLVFMPPFLNRHIHIRDDPLFKWVLTKIIPSDPHSVSFYTDTSCLVLLLDHSNFSTSCYKNDILFIYFGSFFLTFFIQVFPVWQILYQNGPYSMDFYPNGNHFVIFFTK